MGICCQAKEIICSSRVCDVPVYIEENKENKVQNNDNTNNNSVNNDNNKNININNDNNKNNQTSNETAQKFEEKSKEEKNKSNINEKGIEKMNMLLSKKEDLEEIIDRAYEMIKNSKKENEKNSG